MTTKPPIPVQESPSDTMEKIAYASVSAISTVEPNDQYRLGFHVWRWLTSKQGTLEQAIKESGARLLIKQSEALAIIRDSLARHGITSS